MRSLALGALACMAACAAPPGAGVRGGQLRDDDGRALLLRGVNLSGRHRQPPYFDFHQPDDYARVYRDWGMDSIRFLVSWAAVEPERGSIDEDYLAKVRERIGWAEAAGLLVVLDMHQAVFGEGFAGVGDGAPRWACDEARYAGFVAQQPWFVNDLDPRVIACYDAFWASDALQAEYAAAWAAVARAVGDSPAVVGFDPMNEPYFGSSVVDEFEAQRLAPFYVRVADAVRAERPRWIAFLEPSAGRNLGFPTALPAGLMRDAMYAPHSYDLGAERGAGFAAAQRDGVIDNARALRGEAGARGLGLWIGEYGGDASDPAVADYMAAELDGVGEAAAGAMYWEYRRDEGYGLLHEDGTEKTALLDAMVRPYPERVAGDPRRFALDAEDRFTLEYAPDAEIVAPTILIAPTRRYPRGVDVDCGGCAARTEGQRVILTTPPPVQDGVARVVLSPR